MGSGICELNRRARCWGVTGSEREEALCICEVEIVTGRRRDPGGDEMVARIEECSDQVVKSGPSVLLRPWPMEVGIEFV